MVNSTGPRSTHYDTLGLKPTATADDVAQAFARELRRPSAFGGLARIGLAYETLRDPDKRRAYDASIGVTRKPPPNPLQGWQFSISTGGRPAEPVAVDTLSRPAPAAVQPRPDPPETPRTAAFIAASLRELADPAPLVRPSAEPRPEPEVAARPEPEEAPIPNRVLPAFDQAEPVVGDWRRPALLAGGLVAAVGLIGAWAGSQAGNDPAAAQADPAVTMAVPPAEPAREASTARAAEPPALAPPTVRLAEARADPRPGPTVVREPARRALPRPIALTAAEEAQLAGGSFVASATDQAASAAEAVAPTAAPAAAARMPLPDRVVARTIGRIGYACGSVASTTAVEGGEPGVFKVTCASGHSYRAAPVRGRYHFRRWSDR